MTVVANTGPLIALAKIGRMDLLSALGSEVRVPDRVLHELLAKPGADSRRIEACVGTSVHAQPAPSDLAPEDEHATRLLDDGERDVIRLARVCAPPVIVLMDDAAGRRVARALGLTVIGFAGVLIAAKRAGRVDAVCPLLELARRNGYWLSDALVSTVRRLTDE